MPEDCCPNCEALLHGPYCSACGQRQPRPDEYSTFGFLVDAATEIFSVDGKTIRTVRQLFRHPGRLTLDYYQGRRNQYLKPIQLFIIVNVLFLLFAVGFGFFDFTLGDYMESSAPFIRELANQKIDQKGVGFESYAAAFNQNEEILRKGLLFLLVPFFAIAVWALNFQRRRYYAEHLIFSIHFFSFFWLFATCVAWPIVFLTLRARIHPDKVLMPFLALTTLIYLYLMLRTVYAQGRLVTLAKAFICLAAVWALLRAYRVVLFFGTYLIT